MWFRLIFDKIKCVFKGKDYACTLLQEQRNSIYLWLDDQYKYATIPDVANDKWIYATNMQYTDNERLM